MFRALAFFGIFLSLALASTVRAADNASAWVEQNTRTILSEIQRADLAPDDTEGQRLLAERVIIPIVDIDGIAMRAVGRPWRDVSATNQQRFIDGMETRLLDLYGAAFSQFKAADLEVLRERLSSRGDRAIVTTRIRRPGEDWLATEFRLIESNGQWLVLDVAVEGVSLLSSYKAQIDDKIARIGLDATIEEVASGR
ncbi:MAG: MlaC/ttg2D family ABC transporter substrate-binding protein [Litorivicinus sp.]